MTECDQDLEALCRDKVGQGLDFSYHDRVFLCRDRVFLRVGFSVPTELTR